MTDADKVIRQFESERVFRLWDARVSHSLLLIRSPKAEDERESFNLDLMFVGVGYVAIPDLLRGVRVSEGDAAELGTVASRAGVHVSSGRLFVIESGGHRHHVISARLAVLRTSSGRMESSLVVHWSPRAGEAERYWQEHVLEYSLLQGSA